MSTDQTMPPPASSTLPGSAGSAADVDPTAERAVDLDQPLVTDLPERIPDLPEDRIADLDEGLAADLDEGLAADLDGGLAADLDGGRVTDRVADPATYRAEDRRTGTPAESPAPESSTATGDVTGPVTPPADPARHSVGSSWQAEASGDLVAMSFPGARRIAGWLFWVVFPLLCIGTIHTSVTNVVHHLGNKPVGIRGTFVVQPRSCSQGFCSFGGLFSSDDGTIKNLPLLGDPRWHTAEVHKVTYDPRSVEVTALPGHWNPTPTVMATIGALTYLGTIGFFLRQRRRSSRRSAATDAEPARTG